MSKLCLMAALVVLAVVGCAARVVYVPFGEPVRLRETIRQAKVWVVDDQGKPVAGTLDLPEGWYALPLPEEKK